MNSLDDELFSGSKAISNARKSVDLHTNTRGRKLIQCFENNGLIVTNGRYASDYPAQYTHYGPRGFTVIGLATCSAASLHLISDFQVFDLPTLSDHMPISLELDLNLDSNLCNSCFQVDNSLKWNSNCKEKFIQNMKLVQLKDYGENDINVLDNLLKLNVNTAARECGMINTDPGKSKIAKKPWHDKDCFAIKREIKSCLRTCKKSGFSEINSAKLTNLKKEYKDLLKHKKNFIRTNDYGNFRKV